jgi:hypothetical protein
MGPVANRPVEHLGTSDLGIIATRRRLLAATKKLRDEGVTPSGARQPEVYKQRPAAVIIPEGQSWFEATTQHRAATPGVNLPAV